MLRLLRLADLCIFGAVKNFDGRVFWMVVGLANLMFAATATAQTQAVIGSPPNALDLDSVEGFFCTVDWQESAPACHANGKDQINIWGLEGTQRIALDAAGRLWGIRNPQSSGDPGLYVEHNGEGLKVAELPPMASGDMVDSLVLVGFPQMQMVPGLAAALPLRTPVVLTAKRRLYVHVWWTEANDAVTGAPTTVTPGWHEIHESRPDGSLLARPAVPAVGAAPFWDTFLTLSHQDLAHGIRVASLLGVDAALHVVPMHVKYSLNGTVLFGDINLGRHVPNGRFPVLTNELASWTSIPSFGARWGWSPRFYITDGYAFVQRDPWSPSALGPFILEQGRAPQDPNDPEADGEGDWTVLPDNDFDASSINSPFEILKFVEPFEPPPEEYCACTEECSCAIDDPNDDSDDENPRPHYLCNDLPQHCYVSTCAQQVSQECFKPGFMHAVTKVVPADEFDTWGPHKDIRLWVQSDYLRVWGIRVAPPTSFVDPGRIDPWPDLMLEQSGYRPLVDSARGPVYEKLTAGYSELPSEPLSTQSLPLPAAQVALDVFVPSHATGWIGSVQMSFELVAAGISESHMGNASLDELAKGVWSTVTFDVPAQWRQALLGDFPGARFRTFLNTGSAGVRIGALRFQGTPSVGPRSPHQPGYDGVRTTPSLDFETVPGWTGSRLEVASLASSGEYAGRLTSSGWVEIVSPSFSTSSLPAIGTKLSVDVFVPTPSPESHWQGDIQAFLTCQNTSIQNAWIDWSGLQNLFTNEYNTVTFDMPQSIRAALQVANRTCTIRLTVNTSPTTNVASYYVDRVGFRD